MHTFSLIYWIASYIVVLKKPKLTTLVVVLQLVCLSLATVMVAMRICPEQDEYDQFERLFPLYYGIAIFQVYFLLNSNFVMS